jgi:hypothetical protein
MDAMLCMASIYSFVRGAWPDLLANSSSPIGDRGTKVTDDNIGRTLSIIWKKTTLMPLTVWVGEARECFYGRHAAIYSVVLWAWPRFFANNSVPECLTSKRLNGDKSGITCFII